MRPSIVKIARIALLPVLLSAAMFMIVHSALTGAVASSIPSVLTYKYDLARSGENTSETILTTSNVNATHFGKRVSYPVDGQVYAQPLYMPGITIKGKVHNVVFVATEHDSVYAFDADAKSAGAALWHTTFLTGGATTVSSSDVNCTDITPEYGITGTPTIDPATGTLYVVANTKENGQVIYRLHALNITTGLDKMTPVVLQATVTGTGDGSQNGHIKFDPVQQLQRGALLLLNGYVYITFGSHCDNYPYHGWALVYNAATLQRAATFNDSRNGSGSGIWEAGYGLAADSSGNVYMVSGNGTFDLSSGGIDAGDTILKMKLNTAASTLSRESYFTPFNQSCLQSTDNDLGSGGALQIPGSSNIVQAGKEGRIYVLNSANMGRYTADPNLQCGTSEENRTDIDKVVQELPPGTIGGMWSSPAYWNGPTGAYVYFAGSYDHLKAFKVTNGKLSTSPTSQTPENFTFPDGNPVISSNGTTAGTGILWTVDPSGTLRAYDATNLATELFSKTLPGSTKFSVPVVVNGEVFIGTSSTLEIYGITG
jgi:hypothetical protein